MRTDEVTVRSIRFLNGPNLYAHGPMMLVVLSIGRYYDEQPSTSFPGFADRLVAWLPGLREHRCSVGRPGGFIVRLGRGTYLPHITEHVTLELQAMLGFRVGLGRTRGSGEPGVYNIAIAYTEPEPARAAFHTALRLVLAAMHNHSFDFSAELSRLRTIADEYRLGPSTKAILEAAQARHIPYVRLTPTGSLFQLGWGVRQKRFQAAETSYTSSIAADICQEKPLTNQLLRNVGLPVPDGRTVRSAGEAWAAAREIGLPVVVKPADGNQGKGVSVNLVSRSAVLAGFRVARKFSDAILVERYIEGDDYRLLVINGKMAAAARRTAPSVIGDGIHTIRELIEDVNRDPRRGHGHGDILTKIVLDKVAEHVLSQRNLTPLSVPESDQVVKLRHNGNLSTGGTAVDVTDEVHPGVAHSAELAARVIGLDIAGIDIICKDIGRPLGEQGGAIIEVNASPGLRMHLSPEKGQRRAVGKAIVRMLYPQGSPSRIPIISITGTNGKTTVARLIAHMYESAHKVVGMTSTEGIFVHGERIKAGDCAGPRSARSVLSHPAVEVAVLETARGGMLREGLAFDRCKVAVVTNVAADHLGENGIDTLDDMARVKQIPVEAVSRDGAAVLNADDPVVARMARASNGRVVYFSMDQDNPVVVRHLADGGQCVLADKRAILLAAGGSKTELVRLSKVRFSAGGNIHFQVQNALAAAAAAWAAGLHPTLIAGALESFSTDASMLPGRFNVMELRGVQVVVDYAHNAPALAALGQALGVLGKRRTYMVLGLPGDRRDEDILAAVRATTSYVDAYIVRDDHDRRGRSRREIFSLVKGCLPKEIPCKYASGQRQAIMFAMQIARPGERVVLIVDEADEALDLLQSFRQAAARVAVSSGNIAGEDHAA